MLSCSISCSRALVLGYSDAPPGSDRNDALLQHNDALLDCKIIAQINDIINFVLLLHNAVML